jgi:hypothetical protein
MRPSLPAHTQFDSVCSFVRLEWGKYAFHKTASQRVGSERTKSTRVSWWDARLSRPERWPELGSESKWTRYGWESDNGNVWVPTGQGGAAHGGSHWDVQVPNSNGDYDNIYPPQPGTSEFSTLESSTSGTGLASTTDTGGASTFGSSSGVSK